MVCKPCGSRIGPLRRSIGPTGGLTLLARLEEPFFNIRLPRAVILFMFAAPQCPLACSSKKRMSTCKCLRMIPAEHERVRATVLLSPTRRQVNARLPPLHTHRNPRPTPPVNPRLQIRMILNHLKKIPHLTPVRKHIMRKNRRTPTQVNAGPTPGSSCGAAGIGSGGRREVLFLRGRRLRAFHLCQNILQYPDFLVRRCPRREGNAATAWMHA